MEIVLRGQMVVGVELAAEIEDCLALVVGLGLEVQMVQSVWD